MKDLKKVFYIMLCMTVGLYATSCTNNDNNNSEIVPPLTKADKELQLMNMSGMYNGYYFFLNDTTGKTDSIPTRWQITAADSALRILDFPVKTLANGIPQSDARKVLMAGGTVTVETNLHPYANAYNKNGYYTYWMIPRDLKLEFTTEYQGTDYDVKVDFTDQMTAFEPNGMSAIFYAYGEYMERKLMSFILIKSITVGQTSYTTGRACYIYGINSVVNSVVPYQ